MIAWTLRSLHRHEEALTVLQRLEAQAPDAPDGYVFEELGENLLALGRDAQARDHFAKAWELLSRVNSPERHAP